LGRKIVDPSLGRLGGEVGKWQPGVGRLWVGLKGG
jgi:hypothetical protein